MTLEAAPRRAVARIAVDSKYWLWINGELVVFEGQLKRGPNPNDTYYDRVDLTGHLQKGENTVAILVWYYGKDGFSHKSSGKAGLVVDAEVDGKPLHEHLNALEARNASQSEIEAVVRSFVDSRADGGQTGR